MHTQPRKPCKAQSWKTCKPNPRNQCKPNRGNQCKPNRGNNASPIVENLRAQSWKTCKPNRGRAALQRRVSGLESNRALAPAIVGGVAVNPRFERAPLQCRVKKPTIQTKPGNNASLTVENLQAQPWKTCKPNRGRAALQRRVSDMESNRALAPVIVLSAARPLIRALKGHRFNAARKNQPSKPNLETMET